MSTIAAIATGPAAGGIGIIRLSGPSALAAARRVARSLPDQPEPRHAYFARFSDAAGATLDEGLVLFFRAPHSFTGEDVVELHAHGAPRLLSLLLAEVLKGDGVRLATAGEFTRRAFMSGRIDLARAEAVADLVAAESEAQVRAAAAQLSGELTARLRAVNEPLLALQADVEGALDFPEEAEGAEKGARERLDAALGEVRALLADAKRGALIRRGARVVLYGPVNAGKSTLFNALAGADRALVDPEPGTTRDTLEARVEVGGLAVTFVDTAGLRENAGRLEAMGIGRTREALKGADVAVLVLPPGAMEAEAATWRAEVEEGRRIEVMGKADLLEGAAPHPGPLPAAQGEGAHAGFPLTPTLSPAWGEGVKAGLPLTPTLSPAPGEGVKAGLPLTPTLSPAWREGVKAGLPLTPTLSPAWGEGEIRVSGMTGEGVETLRALLAARLGAGAATAVIASSERHLAALEQVESALTRAHAATTVATLEVVAGELGLALHALAELTGDDASEALLDAIFQRFCIGK